MDEELELTEIGVPTSTTEDGSTFKDFTGRVYLVRGAESDE